MAKMFVLIAAAAVFVAVPASPARAQCITFSATASCSARQMSPLLTVDFDVPQQMMAPTRYKAVSIVPLPTDVSDRHANAIDCKMAKPIDPSFTSRMPLMRPDAATRFSGKILPVPGCQV